MSRSIRLTFIWEEKMTLKRRTKTEEKQKQVPYIVNSGDKIVDISFLTKQAKTGD